MLAGKGTNWLRRLAARALAELEFLRDDIGTIRRELALDELSGIGAGPIGAVRDQTGACLLYAR